MTTQKTIKLLLQRHLVYIIISILLHPKVQEKLQGQWSNRHPHTYSLKKKKKKPLECFSSTWCRTLHMSTYKMIAMYSECTMVLWANAAYKCKAVAEVPFHSLEGEACFAKSLLTGMCFRQVNYILGSVIVLECSFVWHHNEQHIK